MTTVSGMFKESKWGHIPWSCRKTQHAGSEGHLLVPFLNAQKGSPPKGTYGIGIDTTFVSRTPFDIFFFFFSITSAPSSPLPAHPLSAVDCRLLSLSPSSSSS